MVNLSKHTWFIFNTHEPFVQPEWYQNDYKNCKITFSIQNRAVMALSLIIEPELDQWCTTDTYSIIEQKRYSTILLEHKQTSDATKR